MSVVNFNVINMLGNDDYMGAVNINKLQYVIREARKLTLGFIDGTESIFPLDLDEADQRWQTFFNSSMNYYPDLGLDMRRVAEIRYFRYGDPDDEASTGNQSVVRIWFDNGSLYLRHRRPYLEEFMVKLIEDWTSSK